MAFLGREVKEKEGGEEGGGGGREIELWMYCMYAFVHPIFMCVRVHL